MKKSRKDQGGKKVQRGGKERKDRKGIQGILILLLLFFIGFGIFSYPFVSNWLAKRNSAMVIEEYEGKLSELSEEEIKELWKKAREYNHALIGQPVRDPFVPGSGIELPQNYLEILDVSEVMAYIEIPKIKVSLPIYHGVSEEVLKQGIGHMEGTAFPVGGDGTHCLLTGHTGLPEAKLFSDLTELKLGDQFYIEVLEKELVYQVDRIEVIEPDQLGDLYTELEKDYITLITCTPYGVNSHRLLVRGTRVNRMKKSIAFPKESRRIYLVSFLLSAVCTLLLAGVCCREHWKKKRFASRRVIREEEIL